MFVMRITFFSSSHPCKLTSLIPLLVPDKLTSVIATLPPSAAMTMRREKGRIVEARFIKCIDSHIRPMESKTLMDCIQSHSLHRLFIHSDIQIMEERGAPLPGRTGSLSENSEKKMGKGKGKKEEIGNDVERNEKRRRFCVN